MNDHYENAEQIERRNLKQLFEHYFAFNNCSDLVLSSTGDKNRIDAILISANTITCAIEYKRRQKKVFSHASTMIEYTKWGVLRRFHCTGMLSLYIIEFDDFTAVFNLSDIFNRENYSTNSDYGFYWKECTSTSNPEQYVKGEKYKLVRDLEFFHECSFYISKDFKRMTFQDVNQYYI